MNILKVLTKQRLVGNIGERAAVKYLKRNGYKILKTNYVFERYEIDVIARLKYEIVFVEVKTRNLKEIGITDALPREAVSTEKMKQITSEARQIFGRMRLRDERLRARFDVIEVYLNNGDIDRIEHLISAYNKNSLR